MIDVRPAVLEGGGIRLEPLCEDHHEALAGAAADGCLWDAIEGLGAKKDGVIRHHCVRRDGTVRDTVMYSILAAEWPDVQRHLELRLARHATSSGT